MEPYRTAEPKNNRWEGIVRPYSEDDVKKLRGSFQIEHTLARMGAERLWGLLQERRYVHAINPIVSLNPS